MKRMLVLVAAASLVGGLAATARAGGLEVRVGGHFPAAGSNLFQDDESLYGTHKSDWQGFTWGGEFSFDVAPRVEVAFGVDGYQKTLHTSYADFVAGNGQEIWQDLRYQSIPVGATFRLLLADKDARVVPYVGAGPDAVFWEYEEYGDFVDFWDPRNPIYTDAFYSDGVAFAGHAAAGLRFAVNDDFRITAEGRYLFAGKQDMGGDFHGNQIDVSGWSATVGFRLQF